MEAALRPEGARWVRASEVRRLGGARRRRTWPGEGCPTAPASSMAVLLLWLYYLR